MKKIVSLALFALLLVSAGAACADAPVPTPAADAPKPEPKAGPKADKEGFVPVAPGELIAPGEVLPASRLVGIAYGVILATIVIWVGSVAARSRKVEDDLAALRAQINKETHKELNKHSDKQRS